ncbi:hypothetical protein GOBAR_AA26550 [Gossypium barbadense]|uniref:Endonuclease/exonuclease/phosphatase domain-containing protein n=1 Tax=Gossypium barbadense TaxID=3634 RepID=A0A2P5WSR0_GOSBA|nr:hypothetical protein GOBAR_AA26550 [Gossypium barbadense]
METKQKGGKLERLRRSFNFDNSFYVELVGRAGGLVLWWWQSININVENFSKNFINVIVKNDEGRPWRCNFSYGSPYNEDRAKVRETLTNFNREEDVAWCCIGDFNEVRFQYEKGGEFLAVSIANSDDDAFIHERLDQVLCNLKQLDIFPHCNGIIGLAIGSNHKPIILKLE